jgi:hypothetical protein
MPKQDFVAALQLWADLDAAATVLPLFGATLAEAEAAVAALRAADVRQLLEDAHLLVPQSMSAAWPFASGGSTIGLLWRFM